MRPSATKLWQICARFPDLSLPGVHVTSMDGVNVGLSRLPLKPHEAPPLVGLDRELKR